MRRLAPLVLALFGILGVGAMPSWAAAQATGELSLSLRAVAGAHVFKLIGTGVFAGPLKADTDGYLTLLPLQSTRFVARKQSAGKSMTYTVKRVRFAQLAGGGFRAQLVLQGPNCGDGVPPVAFLARVGPTGKPHFTWGCAGNERASVGKVRYVENFAQA